MVVEEARTPVNFAGTESFIIDSLIHRGAPFQGHSEVRLEGAWRADVASLASTDVYIIRTSQPLGVLAVELLEAQSDDGLVTWNFFDKQLDDAMKADAGRRAHVVVRALKPIAFPTRIIQ